MSGRGGKTKAKVLARLPGGFEVTPAYLETLRALAKWPKGTAPLHGPLSGGMLAALVNPGLASRDVATDGRSGPFSYRITPAGTDLLAKLGGGL